MHSFHLPVATLAAVLDFDICNAVFDATLCRLDSGARNAAHDDAHSAKRRRASLNIGTVTVV